MKRVYIVLAGMLCAAVIFGCGNSQSQAASEPSAATSTAPAVVEQQGPSDLVVQDYGYVIKDGYVHYAVEIVNPNTGYAAEFPTIKVTGRSSDGSILFSNDWVIGSIMPSSDTYWASQAGRGDTPDDAQIDISVSVNSGNWHASDLAVPSDLYVIENANVYPSEFGGATATGEITLTNASLRLGNSGTTMPMLVCIYRNADGKIVGGFEGYLFSELSEGVPTPFEITSFFDTPWDCETFTVYANPWM